MNRSYKYLIAILQYRNVEYAMTTFLHLHAAIKDLAIKTECKIIIATDLENSYKLKRFHKAFKKQYHFDIHVSNGFYPDKLASIFKKYPKERFETFIKCDEEIFLSPTTWRQFLLLANKELSKPSNLLATVNLSTGIPSWSFFAEAFFTDAENATMQTELLEARLPAVIWNNDYSSLNHTIQSFGTWNEAGYWNAVNQLPYHFKGIHPIRLNIFYSKFINETILSRINQFYDWPVKENFNYVDNRYFCNSFFAIDYAKYQAIIADKDLYVDAFDEVPLNRYRAAHFLNIAFLQESLAVHITYNSVYEQTVELAGMQLNGKQLEDYFMNGYQQEIRKLIGGTNNYMEVAPLPLSYFIKRTAQKIRSKCKL